VSAVASVRPALALVDVALAQVALKALGADAAEAYGRRGTGEAGGAILAWAGRALVHDILLLALTPMTDDP